MYMLIVLLDLLPVLLHLTINSKSVFCFQHLVYSWYRAGSQRKAVSESQLSFAPWIPMPHICMGFPSGSVVKNPPANAGDVRDAGLIPGLGRSPGGGHGNPLQYFFFFNIFLMWTIFKVFIEFVGILFLFYVLVFRLQGIWDPSSLARDWTCTPCIGRWSLNHWTSREVPLPYILK